MAKNPRILIVTPEVTYLPEDMGKQVNYSAKAGGLADVSAALISALFDLNCDIHVALPEYRSIFGNHTSEVYNREIEKMRQRLDDNRIHLAKDRMFYYLDRVYSGYSKQDLKVSLAFQRELMNHIIPLVNPDIIHCNDWTTSLIPAMARRMEIPCLFTIHNIHTMTSTMEEIEDRGIDAAAFWECLYFKAPPINYEHSRNWNKVDFLTSGVFASHYVNTVSPTFLMEIVQGQHNCLEHCLKDELRNKYLAGSASGILNAPEPEFNPAVDKFLHYNYGPKNHHEFKKKNKKSLQEILGIEVDENAPLFFWPSRLDPVQKGCQLLADIMYHIVSKYWDDNLQIVSVGDGEYYKHFQDIVRFHNLRGRIAVCPFHEALSHQAFAGSDFVLMPSSFEPCGLPQMIGGIYGTLPIVYDTGGLHDTVQQLDVASDTGNGFLFNIHDTCALRWAVDQAMDFFSLDPAIKENQIRRIMIESVLKFNHTNCAEEYIKIYEKILKRPFIV